MIFRKKKEEPKKQRFCKACSQPMGDDDKKCKSCELLKKAMTDSHKLTLKTQLHERCKKNQQNILLAIEDKIKKVKCLKGKEKQFDEIYKRMTEYITRLEFESIIDQTLSQTVFYDNRNDKPTDIPDKDTAIFLMNLHWQSIKKDIDKMVEELIQCISLLG